MGLLSVQTLHASYASTCATSHDRHRDRTHQRYLRRGHDHDRHQLEVCSGRNQCLVLQRPQHRLGGNHRHLHHLDVLQHPCVARLGRLDVSRVRLDADQHRLRAAVILDAEQPDAEFH